HQSGGHAKRHAAPADGAIYVPVLLHLVFLSVGILPLEVNLTQEPTGEPLKKSMEPSTESIHKKSPRHSLGLSF
ncbi:MAG: hypothetical protein MK293_13420, partial [Pedosphaera sp.]|nr:hypothetical protein [Pedosphaera sp.]